MTKSIATAVMIAVLAFVAPAFAGTITFSEYPTDTIITNQYAGVVFSAGPISNSPPIIKNDFANPTSPVLSPQGQTYIFQGDFWMTFTNGAYGVSFDSGFWDTVGTGTFDVYDPAHNLLASLTNPILGIYTLDLSAYGIIGSIYFNSVTDPAGAAIDNLAFNSVPEPGSLVLLGSGLIGLAGAIRRKINL